MLKYRYRRITFFFARVIGGIVIWDLLFPRIGLKTFTRYPLRALAKNGGQFPVASN